MSDDAPKTAPAKPAATTTTDKPAPTKGRPSLLKRAEKAAEQRQASTTTSEI